MAVASESGQLAQIKSNTVCKIRYLLLELMIFFSGEMTGIAATLFFHLARDLFRADIGNHIGTATHHHVRVFGVNVDAGVLFEAGILH
jgi:hypothetical protein